MDPRSTDTGCATHESAVGTATDLKMHKAVAALLNRIIDGGNSVRRRDV
jgi:hypothetical protein